jgi:hypothetical protein
VSAQAEIEIELSFWEEHLPLFLAKKEVPPLFPNKEVSGMLIEFIRTRDFDYYEVMQRINRLRQKRKEIYKSL